MQFLGNKALVLRADIMMNKLQSLYDELSSAGIRLNQQSLLTAEELQNEFEYPLSIQITSFSDDTDRRTNIPKVPG